MKMKQGRAVNWEPKEGMLLRWGWINGCNMAVIAYLILMNVLAVLKGLSDRFESQYGIVNILEQIGRYGCMVLMVLPIGVEGWKFGFGSVAEMLIWGCITILLLTIYTVLWSKKGNGSVNVLYGLAIVPAALFLLNGILLRHAVLVIASFIFGSFHFAIVKENV